MKNQYFGDIGDYGKYGLLRFLAKRGVTIAVNWYLTPDDQPNDGSIRGYFDKVKDRKYDPEMWRIKSSFGNCWKQCMTNFRLRRKRRKRRFGIEAIKG